MRVRMCEKVRESAREREELCELETVCVRACMCVGGWVGVRTRAREYVRERTREKQ